MAFDLSVFKASVLHNGLLKPDAFRVRVFAPTGLGGVDVALLHDIELWGEATTLPMYSHGAGQMYRWGYGAMERRPVFPVYEAWSITFRVDEGGGIWRFFKNWNNLVLNTADALNEGKYEINYKTAYLADMGLQIFGKTGELAISVAMIDAFPYAVSPVQLDWGPSREYMKLNVTFAFTDWIEG